METNQQNINNQNARPSNTQLNIPAVLGAYAESVEAANVFVDTKLKGSSNDFFNKLRSQKYDADINLDAYIQQSLLDEQSTRIGLMQRGIFGDANQEVLLRGMEKRARESNWEASNIVSRFLFEGDIGNNGFTVGYTASRINNLLGHNVEQMYEEDPEKLLKWFDRNQNSWRRWSSYAGQLSSQRNQLAQGFGGLVSQYTGTLLDNMQLLYRDGSTAQRIALIGAGAGVAAAVVAAPFTAGASALALRAAAPIALGINNYFITKNSVMTQFLAQAAQARSQLTVGDLKEARVWSAAAGVVAGTVETALSMAGFALGRAASSALIKTSNFIPAVAVGKSIISKIVSTPIGQAVKKVTSSAAVGVPTQLAIGGLSEWAQEVNESSLSQYIFYQNAVKGKDISKLDTSYFLQSGALRYNQIKKEIGTEIAEMYRSQGGTFGAFKSVPFWSTVLLGAVGQGVFTGSAFAANSAARGLFGNKIPNQNPDRGSPTPLNVKEAAANRKAITAKAMLEAGNRGEIPISAEEKKALEAAVREVPNVKFLNIPAEVWKSIPNKEELVRGIC